VRGFDTVDQCPAPTAAPVPPRTSRDPAAVAFGPAVRATRKRRGLSIDTVARDIPRMDAAYLAAIERGWHAVTIVTAKRIAVALKVPLAELVRDL
jgi:ribosome-binding protein aMBF1 (putative translation factor)